MVLRQTAPAATVSACSSDAHKPVARAPASPTSPFASYAPNASARRCDNAPCSISDDTSEVAQSDWPVLCRRIDEVLTGQLPLNPDCPAELESHAQRIAAQLLARERTGTPYRPTDPISNASMSIRSNSSARARSGWSTSGCERWTSSGFVPCSRSWASGHRCAPPPSARLSPAWRARALNAPPGAGWVSAAPWASCWKWTSRPWGRCSSIAPPIR